MSDLEQNRWLSEMGKLSKQLGFRFNFSKLHSYNIAILHLKPCHNNHAPVTRFGPPGLCATKGVWESPGIGLEMFTL